MKFAVGLLALAAFCLQDTLAISDKCGNAPPFACQCDLYMADAVGGTRTVAALLLPGISVEEFVSRVPGKENRKKKRFLKYCREACLCGLRARLLDTANYTLAAKTSSAISATGWNVLCDILYNPTDEVTDITTMVAGYNVERHYWLRVTRRGCVADTNWRCDLYLGTNTCQCVDFSAFSVQKCYSAATFTASGHTVGAAKVIATISAPP